MFRIRPTAFAFVDAVVCHAARRRFATPMSHSRWSRNRDCLTYYRPLIVAARRWRTPSHPPPCASFACCFQRHSRAASSTAAASPPSSATRTSAGVDAEKEAEDLAAAENELRNLRQDVHAFEQKASVGATGVDTTVVAAASSASPSPATASASDGEEGEPAWEEPTLQDLDRSIPQVDSEFIASLIRSRNLRRDEFLRKKEQVKQHVDQLTKKTAPSVADAARLPLVGGLGLSWLSGGINADSEEGPGTEGGVVATSAASPVVVSNDVLEQLNDEEKDLLHTTRPEYDDGFVLIDCRTVNEVTSWGIIEGAKVLPAHELFEAFHATPEEFLHDYGFAKPRPDDIIICYCQFGPRSLMAAQILSWMGYLKVLHYRDGYYEWGKQYNLLLRRWMEHDKESGNELRRLATFRAGLELQREIAPEFNALPMQEAQRYLSDTTRSPGTLKIGEGLRLEAYDMVAKLTEGLVPPALPGVVDDGDSSSCDGGRGGPALPRRLGERHLNEFFGQATGLDPHGEMQRSTASISLGEAQAVVLDSLASGGELGASPDAVSSPGQRLPRQH